MIYLDALTQSDCEQVRKWRNEDISGARTPYILTELQQETFYRDIVSNPDSGHRYWAVRDSPRPIDDATLRNILVGDGKAPRAGKLFVGISGLTNIEWENGRAEIALMIGSDFRGNGYGKEALHETLKQGFERMRLMSIYGNVYECNKSIDFWYKAIPDYNMIIRHIPKGKFWGGKYSDMLFFQADRYEWDRLEKGQK